jgi:hypothetical protein
MQIPLFPGDQLDFVNEVDARRMLQPAEPYLWHAIWQSWERFQRSRAQDPQFFRMKPSVAAQFLTDQINTAASDIADQFPQLGLRHRETSQQEHFVFRNEAVIVFKKITKRCHRSGMKFERSNALTEQNTRRWRQEKEAGFPDLPRFIAGYELLREMSEIRLYVTYPRTTRRGFRWVYEMADHSTMFCGPSLLHSPVEEPDVVEHGFEITLRKGSKERGQK